MKQAFWTRVWKHLWCDEADVRRVLPAAAMARLGERVKASERRHSGEIRLAVEAALPWSYLRRGASARERAITLFGKLRVWDTEHNNGVLVYLLLAEHAIEIVDDRGLDRQVPDTEWRALVERMAVHFKAGRFEEGLAAAIDEIGALLERHFPLRAGESNPNELPDAPHVGG